MKKNIIALFSFAVIMAFTMPATVYADTVITNDSGEKKATMNVSYTIDPSYTVTIPASVTIRKDVPGTAFVSVEDVCIERGQTLNVTLSNAQAQNGQSGLFVSAGADTDSPVLGYVIVKDGGRIDVGTEIISTGAGSVAKQETLSFALSGNYTYSGDYKGTITFTVSIS